MKPETDKLFNLQTILLVPFGIVLNILLAQVAILLSLPLFLDSIGTIVASALGGILPGVMVGFFSNALNSIGDPITLYYGVISVLFALLSSLFSRKGMFTRIGSACITAIPFAIVGGLLGSLLTWALSGLSMGTGVSSPYALLLVNRFGLSPFIAQLTADFGIDLADKIITVLLVFLSIKALPAKLLDRFPNGAIYLTDHAARDEHKA